MNVTILSGRFVRDPEVRYTTGGTPTTIARFTLAVDRRFKKEGQPSADFINCIAFGKSAEFVEKYFKKGMKAEVRGSWQTGSYKKDDGTTVYTNDCFVDEIGFAESKASGEHASASSSAPTPAPTDADGFLQIPDGIDAELPFL